MNRAASVIADEGRLASDGLSEDVNKPEGAPNGKTLLGYTRGARYYQIHSQSIISLYRNTIFCRLDNPGPLRGRRNE